MDQKKRAINSWYYLFENTLYYYLSLKAKGILLVPNNNNFYALLFFKLYYFLPFKPIFFYNVSYKLTKKNKMANLYNLIIIIVQHLSG